LYGVVDGKAGCDGAARRVDVETDGSLRVVGFEVEEHGNNRGRTAVLDRAAQADNALFEKTRENVIGKEVAAWTIVSAKDSEIERTTTSPVVSVMNGVGTKASGLTEGGRARDEDARLRPLLGHWRVGLESRRAQRGRDILGGKKSVGRLMYLGEFEEDHKFWRAGYQIRLLARYEHSPDHRTITIGSHLNSFDENTSNGSLQNMIFPP